MQGECKKQVYLFICRNLVPTRAESNLFGLYRVTPRFNKVSRSHFYAKRSEMKVVYKGIRIFRLKPNLGCQSPNIGLG